MSTITASSERTTAKWMFTFERRRLLRLIAGKNDIEVVTRSLNKLNELWKSVKEKQESYLKATDETTDTEDYWLRIVSLDLEEAEEKYKSYIMCTAEALETTSIESDTHKRMIENEKHEESTFQRKVDILNDFLDSSSESSSSYRDIINRHGYGYADSESSTSYLEITGNGYYDVDYQLELPERPDGSRNF